MRAAPLPLAELERLLAQEFPQAFGAQSRLRILDAGHAHSSLRLDHDDTHLRPGGTISGHAMMMLADDAMYVAVLASIGWRPLAVTTNLNINFLRKPAAGALVATCRIIKLGSRLVVGDVAIRSEGQNDMAAHATSTYSIPPTPSTTSVPFL